MATSGATTLGTDDFFAAVDELKPASKGSLPAAAAFAIWGLFPLYFHPLRQVSALQVIAHRVVWSCLFVFVWMAMRSELSTLRATLADRSALWRLALTATLIPVNWLVYVWGVMNGHVVETSLGYFIGPMVNVLLGVVLLSERLTPAQWTAVALAAADGGTAGHRPLGHLDAVDDGVEPHRTLILARASTVSGESA